MMAEKKTKAAAKKTVTVRQISSADAQAEGTGSDVGGLGLGKIRRKRTLEDTPPCAA